jgi:hypothetical protein
MPRRYWRQVRPGDTVSSLFGGKGWLVVDVMVAIVAALLLTITVATPSPAAKPRPRVTATPTSTPLPAPTPTVTATTQPGPALDFQYVSVTLNINPSALSATGIKHALLTNPSLKGRRAGLVMLFGGGSSSGSWPQLDSKVWKILQSMSDVTPLFSEAVDREFWNGGPLNQFLLNIYLFVDT